MLFLINKKLFFVHYVPVQHHFFHYHVQHNFFHYHVQHHFFHYHVQHHFFHYHVQHSIIFTVLYYVCLISHNNILHVYAELC